MKVKEESEKVGLKLNIQKTKIMASGPITSWETGGETVETVSDSSTLATSCEVLTHWKTRILGGVGGRRRRGDRGWDGWMASLTRWTWVWVNSWSWWWAGRPGVLWFMGSQKVGHDWATELNWTEVIRRLENLKLSYLYCYSWFWLLTENSAGVINQEPQFSSTWASPGTPWASSQHSSEILMCVPSSKSRSDRSLRDQPQNLHSIISASIFCSKNIMLLPPMIL